MRQTSRINAAPHGGKRVLAHIVERASTVRERLWDDTFQSLPPGTEEVVAARLKTWCEAASGGDVARFQRRLIWDGLDTAAARRAVGPVRLRRRAALPPWAELLSEVMTHARRHVAPGLTRERSHFIDSDEPLPFEDILAPLVFAAHTRLLARGSGAAPPLTAQAYTMLGRDLLRSLVSFSALTLYLHFSLLRRRAESSLAGPREPRAANGNRTLYDRFSRALCAQGLLPLFREYPVLARLLGTISHLWVEANGEFLERLRCDLPDIQRAFGAGSDLGDVVGVEPSLSDPHAGRRSVTAVTFASGRRIVYKPRDVGMERAYNRLLVWLNEHGAPLALRPLQGINRSGYGWVEWVEHSPCTNRAEVSRYYQRAGMLLCLAYVLGGTDLHHENLIADGEHPVLVDAETLMHPQVRAEYEPERDRDHESAAFSVQDTGLLPKVESYGPRRVRYDGSGLSSSLGRETPDAVLRWHDPNTYDMQIDYGRPQSGARTNVPVLEGAPVRVEDYAADVEQGFTDMYALLKDNRYDLQTKGGCLDELAQQRVRFVYRCTRVYRLVLEHSLKPQYLKDGADWSVQLELLARGVMPLGEAAQSDGKRPLFWPILDAEVGALTDGDIPRFTARANERSLHLIPDRRVEYCLMDGAGLALDRLNALSDVDLERQLEVIRDAFKSLASSA